MFRLTDIRKTAVWQEALNEGREEGREEGLTHGEERAKLNLVRNWLARGKTVKQIAELLDITPAQARQLAKKAQKAQH